MGLGGLKPTYGALIIQAEAALVSSILYLMPWTAPYMLIVIAATVTIPSINRSIYSPSFQRQTAWVLLALSIMEALTGFAAGPVSSNLITAATGGLLTRGVGLELHLLLIDPLAFFFTLHIASGIGLALIRRGVRWTPIYTIVIPALLLLGFATVIYLDSLFFF
ncbi:hypothetical protein [Caldivirga sp. MU80]|uniref:hypothetical protein n=1 Tax=Caldivirga sp. MU80 TaxID=1650354 RepID=UPI000837260D|nr:hypothetical protein [Caldivirga sp. MU80]